MVQARVVRDDVGHRLPGLAAGDRVGLRVHQPIVDSRFPAVCPQLCRDRGRAEVGRRLPFEVELAGVSICIKVREACQVCVCDRELLDLIIDCDRPRIDPAAIL